MENQNNNSKLDDKSQKVMRAFHGQTTTEMIIENLEKISSECQDLAKDLNQPAKHRADYMKAALEATTLRNELYAQAHGFEAAMYNICKPASHV